MTKKHPQQKEFERCTNTNNKVHFAIRKEGLIKPFNIVQYCKQDRLIQYTPYSSRDWKDVDCPMCLKKKTEYNRIKQREYYARQKKIKEAEKKKKKRRRVVIDKG